MFEKVFWKNPEQKKLYPIVIWGQLYIKHFLLASNTYDIL